MEQFGHDGCEYFSTRAGISEGARELDGFGDIYECDGKNGADGGAGGAGVDQRGATERVNRSEHEHEFSGEWHIHRRQHSGRDVDNELELFFNDSGKRQRHDSDRRHSERTRSGELYDHSQLGKDFRQRGPDRDKRGAE